MKLSENTRYHKYVFVCSINCLSYYLGKKMGGRGAGGGLILKVGPGLSKKSEVLEKDRDGEGDIHVELLR